MDRDRTSGIPKAYPFAKTDDRPHTTAQGTAAAETAAEKPSDVDRKGFS